MWVLTLAVVFGAAAALGARTWLDLESAHFTPGVARIDGYARDPGGREITLDIAIGAGDAVDRVDVIEEAGSPGRILVTVRTLVYVPPRGTFKNLAATLTTTRLTLQQPIGDRSVYDLANDRVVKRVRP